MASPRAIARALARGAEKTAPKAENAAQAAYRAEFGPETLYKGVYAFDPVTRKRIPADQLSELKVGPSGATWLTPDKPLAEAFAVDEPAQAFVTRAKNIKEIDWGGRNWTRAADDELARAKAEGYEGVRFTNMRDDAESVGNGRGPKRTQVALFNPEQIRRPNAAFDPAKRDSRDLLAATIPATAALGAGALAMQPGEAEAAPRIPKGITAYHGSPYWFDRFDMSRLGTGEGAQVYGHGLYFAGNPQIARWYRENLSPGYYGDVWEKGLERALIEAGAPPNIARGTARGRGGATYQKTFDKIASGADPDQAIAETLAGVKSATPEDYETQRAVVRALLADKDLQAARGAMYEVRLNVEPDQLLDWDAPISMGADTRGLLADNARPLLQSPSADLRNIGRDALQAVQNENMTGAGLYRQLANTMARKDANPTARSAMAAQELQGAGFPGLKYLDGNSRAAGEGTRNYVMFDDKLVDILKRYGIAAGATGVAAGVAGAPQEAQAQTLQPPQPSALARALARQAPRFNAALDTSLDVASIADPSLGYVTETTRALKDLPGQIQGNALQKAAGTVALAPLVGIQESVGSIGQLPELGVAGGRAIARAIARKPQPRGSGTYRKAK